MSKTISEQIHRINYLTAEMDALYHQASLKIGLADSSMRVLYTIYDNGEWCLLSDIYKQSDISKQTVNSALRKLEAEDIIYLENFKGRSKKVLLTEKGKEYIRQTAARLYQAEKNVYDSWTEEDLNTYVHLTEKYVDLFREQVKKL